MQYYRKASQNMKQKVISSSFKESFCILKKHKKAVLLLFFIELFFFASLSAVAYLYLPKIINPIIDMEKNMAGENLLNPEIQNSLGVNTILLYRNLASSFEGIRTLMVYLLIIYIISAGISWYSTERIIRKNKAEYIIKFALASAAFLSIPSLLLYQSLKPSAIVSGFPVLFLSASFMAALYFMFLSFPLISILNISELPKKLYEIGIKKIANVLAVYVSIGAVLLLSAFLTYISLDSSMFLIAASIILFLLCIVWSRLFFILAVEKLCSD